MNFQDRLIEFVKYKSRVIENRIETRYVNIGDIAEIERWSEKVCESIYKTLCYNILVEKADSLGWDTDPWCIFNNYKGKSDRGNCAECGYADRHGECGSRGSLYKEYNTNYIRRVFSNNKYERMIHNIENY